MSPKSANNVKSMETTIFVFDLAKKESCYRHRQNIEKHDIVSMSNRKIISAWEDFGMRGVKSGFGEVLTGVNRFLHIKDFESNH